MAMVAMYLPQPLSPNFLQNERALSLSTIGQLISVGSVGIVVLNLFLGQFPVRTGYPLGQAAVGCFALFLWWGNGRALVRGGLFFPGRVSGGDQYGECGGARVGAPRAHGVGVWDGGHGRVTGNGHRPADCRDDLRTESGLDLSRQFGTHFGHDRGEFAVFVPGAALQE